MTAAEHFDTSSRIVRGRGMAQKSRDLIEAARDWLETANPTSVRGVCYYLFTQGVIDSMEKRNTAKVSRLLTVAREQGLIPWGWIVDEARELERVSSWEDAAAYVRAVRRSYRRDFWAHQPNDVEVWSEKGTVRGILQPVLDEYGVGFRVMHGFGSATAIHNIAQGKRGHWLHALYVGDWDPSGLYMSEHDLPERLAEYGGHHVILDRVALKEADVYDSDLPSFPADTKRGDPRYQWFTENHSDECWEIDAMDPNDLRERVRHVIEYYIRDKEAWEQCKVNQEAEQESLQSALDSWTALKGKAT